MPRENPRSPRGSPSALPDAVARALQEPRSEYRVNVLLTQTQHAGLERLVQLAREEMGLPPDAKRPTMADLARIAIDAMLAEAERKRVSVERQARPGPGAEPAEADAPEPTADDQPGLPARPRRTRRPPDTSADTEGA